MKFKIAKQVFAAALLFGSLQVSAGVISTSAAMKVVPLPASNVAIQFGTGIFNP
jgi:hypothetical protein